MLKILEKKSDNITPTIFEFEIDNIPANFPQEEKNIYSKIYFNCLEFPESLKQYGLFKQEIIDKCKKSIEFEKVDKNEKISEELLKELDKYYINKIICFASLLPFNKELSSLLLILYNFYISNIQMQETANQVPIEKILEQMIIKTPLPIMSNSQVSLYFKFNNLQTTSKALSFDKITFPAYNIKEPCLQFYRTRFLGELFTFFSVDEILKILKYIMLEIPVLFFSENKSYLSLFVDNLLSLLYPFRYVLPCISILPNELYGLINSEPKFVFGINEKYSRSFFEDNNLDIDKSIVFICLNNKNKSENKIIDQIKKLENLDYFIINDEGRKKNSNDPKEDDEYINFKGTKIHLLNIDLPGDEKKNASSSISSLLSTFQKNPNLPKEKTNVRTSI